MATCIKCGKEVIPDEIGLTKKMINRGTNKYYCKTCLAKEFGTTEEKLDELIKEFKSQGCTLFSLD